MQMVEIAKALALNARLIIMDEPTAPSRRRIGTTFQDHRRSKRRIAIIYISHRMEEVLEMADRITVLRDGRCVGDLPPLKPRTIGSCR